MFWRTLILLIRKMIFLTNYLDKILLLRDCVCVLIPRKSLLIRHALEHRGQISPSDKIFDPKVLFLIALGV